MRIFVAALAVASFAFGSARANAVHYDITGLVDGTPDWPAFVASGQAPFRIDFTLDLAHLTQDYQGLYLSITPTDLSYEVGGLTKSLTHNDVALEVISGYPQLYFNLLNGNDLLNWQFSITGDGSNPLYTESANGPSLQSGVFDHLALSRAEI